MQSKSVFVVGGVLNVGSVVCTWGCGYWVFFGGGGFGWGWRVRGWEMGMVGGGGCVWVGGAALGR